MKIAAIPGSLRQDSYNRHALRYIIQSVEKEGAEVSVLDLREYVFPIYDEDIEREGEPEIVTRFKDVIRSSDGIIICSPEYNHSIPGGLKNAIDWASRGKIKVFHGKHVALAGCSTGFAATTRMQMAMLPIIRTLGMNLLNKQVYIGSAASVFDENGSIKEERIIKQLADLGAELVKVCTK